MSLAAAQRVERVCTDFEAAWRATGTASRRPRVEDYLGTTAGPERSALARELILLEIYYRGEAGENLAPQEYNDRFPDLDQIWLTQAVGAPCGPAAPAMPMGERAVVAPTQRLSGVSTTNEGWGPGRRFGDYELLEELGRGGMGVIYKARQQGLARLVALKMVLGGQLAGTAEVQRFRLEAEAVAHLDHPHIIPIYEVGVREGFHYFSMKFVEGGSLAQAIGSGQWAVDSPDHGRRAAQFLATVAKAVHYAHRHGILHRDLKPANILLSVRSDRLHAVEPGGPDESGPYEPYVTDFGLAKRVERPGDLTETGAVLGTPSYMAPEQAAGRKDVSTAADVYGLGAILYELLAGQPPFRGETPLETLANVQEREPDRVRTLNPRVDADLETICLKCLEKDPKRRYGSAEALAQDLERWLAGEPIQARPVGRAERCWRWCRRHPATAGLAAAVVLSLLAGTGVALYFAVQASAQAAEALEAKRQAEVSAANAKRQAQEARRQQQRAEASYRLARRGLRQVITKVGEDPRVRSGPLEDLRRTVLEAERGFFEEFVQLRGNEPDFQLERGRAYMRLAGVNRDVGRTQQAEAAGMKAADIFRQLAKAHKDEPRYPQQLASTLQDLGVLYMAIGRNPQAEQALNEAAAIQRQLAASYPREPAYPFALSEIYNNLAIVYHATKRPSRMEAVLMKARGILQKLVNSHPKVPEYLSRLGGTQNHLGILYSHTGRRREAAAAYQDGLANCKRLAESHRQVARYQRDLAASYTNLAAFYHETGQPERAHRPFKKALAIRKRLADTHPVVIQYAVDLVAAYHNLGKAAYLARKPQEALAWYAKAQKHLDDVAPKAPQDAGVRSYRCVNCWDQAVALGALGRHAEALANWDQAIPVADPPNHALLRLYRAWTLARLKDHARATAEAGALVQGNKNISPDTLHNVACIYAISAAAVREDPARASAYAARAVALLRQAIQKGYTDLASLKQDKDLDLLRQRADFQKLLSQLAKKP
jgi:tetratricopeptide (TPR) repeat protein